MSSWVDDISGTSATSLFFRSASTFWHFDGTAFRDLSALLSGGVNCVLAVGPRRALVVKASGGLGTPLVLHLHEITEASGTWTVNELGSTNASDGACALSQLPGGEVFLAAYPSSIWTGSTFIAAGATPGPVEQTQPRRISVFATSRQNAIVIGYGVHLLLGNQWTMVNPGFSPQAVSGTSATRAFVVGFDDASHTPRVAHWDGVGLSPATVPEVANGLLWDAWAAPTGEVFAVGNNGVILKGP